MEALSVKKFNPLYKLLLEEKEKMDDNLRQIIDEKELWIGRIISVIVGFLIKDVILCSGGEINTYASSLPYFDKCLIHFSEKEGKQVCEFLKKVVNKRVI